MTVKLVIDGRLPNLNDYIDAERKHRQQAANMKRQAQRAVSAVVQRQLRGVRFDRPVVMRYTWVEPDRRRDKDNVSAFGRKVIQDALVQAKVLRNDGWAEIESFTDIFRVDKRRPRIEVEIEEATT